MRKFFKSFLIYSFSYGFILLILGTFLFALLTTIKSLISSFIGIIPNKNSLFFEILKFNYHDFLPSFLISAIISFIIFVSFVTVLLLLKKRMDKRTFLI